MERKTRRVIVGIGTLMMAAGMAAQVQASEVTIDEKWIVSNQEESVVLQDAVRNAFANVLKEKVEKIGICDGKGKINEETGLISPYESMSGICYAVFVDFEKDEIPELYLLSYDKKEDGTPYLLEEIYYWDGTEVQSVFEEEHMGSEEEEKVTELYHESGPVGRYQQGILKEQQEEDFCGALYRMKQGELNTYFLVDAKKNGNSASEWSLTYSGDITSYETIDDLETKLRTVVGANMRSKLLSSTEEGKIVYDSFCTPVIYEKEDVYAAYNDVNEIYKFLKGDSHPVQTQETQPETVIAEPQTEAVQPQTAATEPQTEAVQPQMPETEEQTEAVQPQTTSTITYPETTAPQTEGEEAQETMGVEEMKYYLYIQSQLIPAYGLVTSTEMAVNDTGMIASGSERGVMSAVFSDVNGDGQKEMILAYLKNDSQEYTNQVIFELYGIRYGEVVKFDDTEYYPADKQNQLALWSDTQVYIKGKYLCVYTMGGSPSFSSRYTDLYVYDLSQNQITMIRDYDFMRVPGMVTMSEGVQQLTYYSGDESQISDTQKTETQQKIQSELNYFGIPDLSVWIGDPMDSLSEEYQISGKKMWSSVGINMGNFENQTIQFEDSSNLLEYVTPIQIQETPQTEAVNPSSEYILPGSDTHYLTQEEINSVPSNLLEYACNEIYARHGRRFLDSAFQNYFNSKSWYRGTVQPDQFDVAVFNTYETENIMRLVERMKQLGIR